MSAGDDWRLRDQEKYLTGKTLRWARWWSDNPQWDHDHCEFCWAKFMGKPWEGDPEIQLAGYVTEDNYRWICRNCYEDFRERFKWQVTVE